MRLSPKALILGVLAFAIPVLTESAFAANSPAEYIPGRLLVQKRFGANSADVSKAIRANGGRADREIPALGVTVISLPENASERAVKALSDTGLFTAVERDYVAHGAVIPNDPSYGSQWHLAQIQAPAAWDLNLGSASITIAIVDSGVDGTHPDLAGKLVAGWNFLGGNTNTADVLGHGTAVAGTAAAATDNTIGVAGVTWKSPIMPLVVLDASDYASYSNIASAITYAADHGVRLINVSICGTSASSTLQSAVDYAWNKGAIVIAAAGNSSASTRNYPAACNHAIAVSATDKGDAVASFTNYGSWVTLSAPGNYILTTKNGGTYSSWYGTSFASPIVAGVAALALSAMPNLDNASLLNLLEQNADDLGAAGFDNYYGWGRVNAYKTVQAAAAISSDTIAPQVTISAPAADSTVAGTVSVTGSATDNIGVTKVEFYADGTLAASTASAAFTFSWNSTAVANGAHTLMVKAYDLAGNSGLTSAPVNVSNAVVADLQPPTVTITAPAPNSVVSTQTTISVSATDNVGVTQVSVYVDGTQLCTTTVAPYSCNWNAKRATSGAHTISARAWDKAGNYGSASETVTRR